MFSYFQYPMHERVKGFSSEPGCPGLGGPASHTPGLTVPLQRCLITARVSFDCPLFRQRVEVSGFQKKSAGGSLDERVGVQCWTGPLWDPFQCIGVPVWVPLEPVAACRRDSPRPPPPQSQTPLGGGHGPRAALRTPAQCPGHRLASSWQPKPAHSSHAGRQAAGRAAALPTGESRHCTVEIRWRGAVDY